MVSMLRCGRSDESSIPSISIFLLFYITLLSFLYISFYVSSVMYT